MDMPPPFGPHGFDGLRRFLSSILNSLPQKPAAMLVISAHWEEKQPTLGATSHPDMIYDYYGFPEHTYHLQYPALGAPTLAHKAHFLLEEKGIHALENTSRGFDHGVFVPLMIIAPEAQIPIATLSLQNDLDPLSHWAIGSALAPLRDENVLIIGSGNSYHNLAEFWTGMTGPSEIFDQWLNQTVTALPPTQRKRELIAWEQAPAARACHPREEHLLPLMVIAGSAEHDTGHCIYREKIGGKYISSFAFGERFLR